MNDSKKLVWLASSWKDTANSHPAAVEISKRVELFDWEVFRDMPLDENCVVATEVIENCYCYAAIFNDPEHEYRGTLEWLMAAVALNKPVYVYVDCPELEEPIGGSRPHRWGTKFDRFPIYNPRVTLFTQGQEHEFVEAVCSMNVSIRTIQKQDIENLLTIIIENVKEVNGKHYPKDVIEKIVAYYTYEEMELLMLQDKRIMLVAEDSNNVLGTATLIDGDIRMVFVDRHIHGKGVGRKLIEEIESIAKHRGLDKITVDSSLNAEGFYKRLGFEGDTRKTVFGGTVIIQLEKKLT